MILTPIPTCGVLHTPTSDSPALAECPAVQRNADTTTWKVASESTGQARAESHKPAHPAPLHSQSRVLVVTWPSDGHL